MSPKDPPLDEIQWRSPQIVASMGGLHDNTVLHYFAESPFFEPTSNNAVLTSQAWNNPQMAQFIATREAMEDRLRTMSGLEFMVAEAPADPNPGMGTGVWVIRKQTRRKQPGRDDDITIHATYFVVGEHIYQAPTLGDVLTSKLNTVTESLSKVLPEADSIRDWTPALGNVYRKPKQPEAEEPSRPAKSATNRNTSVEAAMQASLEEAFFRHKKFGGDYMDQKIVTGEPGNFKFSTTTKPASKPQPTTSGAPKPAPLAVETAKPGDDKKVVKADKSPKTPNMPAKPKRRKSKGGPASAS